MALKSEGLVSVIKYEGNNDTLIWKHPTEDFRYGSQLIVHESQEAIFFRDGQALDLFGPGRYTLETQILPVLEKAYKLPTGGEQAFHSEVYFINKAVQMALKWGTPEKIRFIDPLTGVPLELGASGELNLMVSNSRKLLVKLVGTMDGISWEDGASLARSLKASFRPLISNAVKVNLSNTITDEAIDILEIDSRLDTISAKLREKILPGFEDYGLTIPQFYVTNIVLPEEDPNFKYRTAQEQSRAAITAAHRGVVLEEQTTQTEIAKREAERKVITAQAEAAEERIAGLTEAEIMQAKGYNQKDVLQAEVQKAYAEGIGNMGPAISAGGGGSGVLGDMLGLGVGVAAAGAIAPQIGNMLQGFQNPAAQGAAPYAAPAQPPAPAAPAPTVQQTGWTCPSCGKAGIASRFCPDCGTKKPEPAVWTCPDCGTTKIASRFCPNCGHKREE